MPSFVFAHRSNADEQSGLVKNLQNEGVIRSEKVAQVMSSVDRANYINSYDPYFDSPQGIQCGQTISAPHMHAFGLEEMLPAVTRADGEVKMLDVGCGSGA